LPQDFEVYPPDVLHEHIDSISYVIIKYIINTGQGVVVQLLEPSIFKPETVPLWLVRDDPLFEGEMLLLIFPVFH
jgi:hypothetical protein